MGIARQGKRHTRRQKLKEVKGHKREFFNILAELDRIIPLLEQEDVTEDNMEEKVAMFSDIKVGKLEKLVLKGRLKIGADE